MFDGFAEATVAVGGHGIFCRVGGSGPPVLLLHGFPETHLMWRHVGPPPPRHFTIVAADLPGYGASDCPPDADNHAPSSKRGMGDAIVAAMKELGLERFTVVGHD